MNKTELVTSLISLQPVLPPGVPTVRVHRSPPPSCLLQSAGNMSEAVEPERKAPTLITDEHLAEDGDSEAVSSPSPGRQTGGLALLEALWGSSLGTVTLRRSAGSCSEQKMLLISAGCDFFHLPGSLIWRQRMSVCSGGCMVERKELSVNVLQARQGY